MIVSLWWTPKTGQHAKIVLKPDSGGQDGTTANALEQGNQVQGGDRGLQGAA